MHNTWLVIRREYLERIRTKAFIIMTLLMPVFMGSTILIPALLSDMKSGVTRRIVLVANNPEIAEGVDDSAGKERRRKEGRSPLSGGNGQRYFGGRARQVAAGYFRRQNRRF